MSTPPRRAPARPAALLLPALVSALALGVADPAQGQSGALLAPGKAGAATAALAPGKAGGAAAVAAPERAQVRRAPDRVLAGRPVRLRGFVSSGRRGRPVLLQRRTDRGWRTVDRTRTRRGGAFAASWRPSDVGRHALRVRPGGGRAGRPGEPGRPRVVRVFRRAVASWFGPGFYGQRTACGQTMAPGTLGVAHKGLPCGTRVTFVHEGRTVTVPVIDRGPFVGSREWDLTAAARQRLGAPSTGLIWSSH